jgi:DNA-binding XRE family transcriptional regulator
MSRMGLKVPHGASVVKKASEKRRIKPLASSQIRAARALLRWTADDLAREAALGRNTILRAEIADDQTSLTVANDLAVRRALEGAGVEFIDENSGGPGVRLRKRQAKKA